MSDDRRRVLDLLAQGKVTVEEADQLLQALTESSSSPEEPKTTANEPTTPRFVRINVHKPGKQGRPDKDVNIRVPLALLRGGMRLSTMIPGLQERMSARLRERGVDIDLAKFDSSSIEAMIKDLGEVHIDVHEGDEQVRITCE